MSQSLTHKVFAVVVMVLITRFASVVSMVIACREPEDGDLLDQLLNHTRDHTGIHESFYRTSPWIHLMQSQEAEDNATISLKASISDTHLRGETACQINTGDHKMQSRTLCPWHEVINHDGSRYPRDIVESRCNCSPVRSCVQISGSCQPVLYNMRVLRRTGCVQGLYRYLPDWYQLTVGCTCMVPMMPIVHISDRL